MHFDKQHDSSEFVFRQEKYNLPSHRRRSCAPKLIPNDAAERYILENGLSPAVERDGFWRGCWLGIVAIDSNGRRESLDDKPRRAMRRLLERGAFGSLIDLREQNEREALDRRLRYAERRERRQYGWAL